MNKLLIAAAAVMAMTGCAKKAASIAPAYVSPLAYQGSTCEALTEEAKVVSSRAAAASGAQDNQAGKDAALTAVGVVVFWPALFFLDGNGEKAAEVARLKGEMQAIEDASRRKGCGITFQPVAPTKPPIKKA
ncbi:hypothetical protein [Aureimonas psammosilenae]|uniref:hypothetical protein n=1 Tax=Aureimonas psammosilenae TaxID=2495496 RepID=UPI001260C2CD|nr:hypothetical protein [Aureimonas psammosilenae]